jgi:hypothetical protein
MFRIDWVGLPGWGNKIVRAAIYLRGGKVSFVHVDVFWFDTSPAANGGAASAIIGLILCYKRIGVN